MFSFSEVEKMFFDPIDLAISKTNDYLYKIEIFKSIFS